MIIAKNGDNVLINIDGKYLAVIRGTVINMPRLAAKYLLVSWGYSTDYSDKVIV
jgi:hypothetical protein